MELALGYAHNISRHVLKDYLKSEMSTNKDDISIVDETKSGDITVALKCKMLDKKNDTWFGTFQLQDQPSGVRYELFKYGENDKTYKLEKVGFYPKEWLCSL